MRMIKFGSFLKEKVVYVCSFSYSGWRYYYNFVNEYFLNILFFILDIIWFILYLYDLYNIYYFVRYNMRIDIFNEI